MVGWMDWIGFGGGEVCHVSTFVRYMYLKY